MSDVQINDVSDTAFWVAVYRAGETERQDALFKDPLAKKLSGERGQNIANAMVGSRFTKWNVVIRTVIIDRYIQKLATEVDTVVNIGAGLDTRPYRLQLPASLRWIEADYAHMIEFKNKNLKDETPICRLERIAVDLADDQQRIEFLKSVAVNSQKILVLTEGVVPYLSEAQVGKLADELQSMPNFKYWILDYISHRLKKYINTKKRKQQMRNAPFLFFPEDWFGFFESHGWKVKDIQYIPVVSKEVGRSVPYPWWVYILKTIFFFAKPRPQDSQYSGYALLTPKH